MTNELFRVLFGLAFVLNLVVSEFLRRRAAARRIIAVERRDSTLHFIVTSIWGTCLYGILLVVLCVPTSVAWAAIEQPSAIHWFGAGLALGSLPLTLWIELSLGDNLAGGLEVSMGSRLVTKGPYRRIRHPLYLVRAILLTGLSLLSANVLVAAASTAGIVLMRFVVIPREERTLASRFGKRFTDYSARTGIWVPLLRKPPQTFKRTRSQADRR